MIEDPGSFSGNSNSPIPHLGPLPNNLISFAILFREHPIVFSVPENSTRASVDYKASNLLGAVTNLRPVSFETYSAICSAHPSKVFKPVPTAVPP